MKLVIVESPAKAKTIQKYLGEGYIVEASGGHVADLPEKTLGIDINNAFEPEYVINAKKKDLVKRLTQSVKKSEEVFLATDPDREGEAISWHLANVLSIPDAARVEFNEISPKAVKNAIANPRKININLVDAQQARRVLDRLVGYKISPVLSRKIKSNLSGGRVQSAALKIVVDREREIRAFIPSEYWNIKAVTVKPTDKNAKITALLNDKNGKKLEVHDKETADDVLAKCKTAVYSVDTVKRGKSKSRPQPPFTTSTLQQDGCQKLGISAPDIMKIAQELYEGIDTPNEGHVAFVTYIRTDSVRISAEMQQTALDYIKATYGDDYMPAKPNFYATKAQNTQDAHEAIRPISLDRTPDSVKNTLSKYQYRLYKLIYERFLASQMTEAEFDTLSIRIQATANAAENFGFKATGRTCTFKGYTVVYEDAAAEKSEEEIEGLLPNVTEGEPLNLAELKPEQKFTKPPARFTDSSLVKAMEESGIGRPSTYATIITTIQKRNYVVKEQKLMKATALGEQVTVFMEKCFTDIVDAKFTAGMEEKLDTIEDGVSWKKIIGEFYPPFEAELKAAYGEDKMPTTEPVKTDVICEKCGANMILREGRFGKFLACPNYPTCKNTKPAPEDKAGVCPLCGHDIIRKRTKTGKTFYGCSNYPACNFMSWNPPAPQLCPECQSPMSVAKKNDETRYICTNAKCKNVILVAIEATENDAN
ncbi:MAG: type I DNA topoisomerase [Christensenellaceae bacterium]|jgi:DNA topoisomerase-1|nr:type I DNA topoisomerase [Christensenellaceae bacterium]